MEHEMEIAVWSRVIGILFKEKLAEARPNDGLEKHEKACEFIETVKCWQPHVVNIPDERKLGFAFPSEPDDDAFFEARDLFYFEWKTALEEMRDMVTAGDITWDNAWEALRLCHNSYRPMSVGFMYGLDHYATMADLLMDVPWKDYLASYENGGNDCTMYTMWEGYLRY